MPELKLYFAPRACSRVTMTALIKTGLDFDTQVINIFKGEQYSPEYRKIHRSGKVPALVVDGVPVTENASILSYIDAIAPDAGVLPKTDSLLEKATQRSDLVWCSATIHPMVRQIRMPMRFTDGDTAGVYAVGTKYLKDTLAGVEQRLSEGKWWYGDDWSIVDVYLNWCVMTAASADFPLHEFPAVAEHCKRVPELEPFQKAVKVEDHAMAEAGIVLPG
ncbi:MAG: glutathione S-transferase family protein [Pseudomonadota bacterium]